MDPNLIAQADGSADRSAGGSTYVDSATGTVSSRGQVSNTTNSTTDTVNSRSRVDNATNNTTGTANSRSQIDKTTNSNTTNTSNSPSQANNTNNNAPTSMPNTVSIPPINNSEPPTSLSPITPKTQILGVSSTYEIGVILLIVVIGVFIYLWLTARKPHVEQLIRLGKQRQRISSREASQTVVYEDIFEKVKDNYLGRILAEAGLESQYDKMKTNWIMFITGITLGMLVLCLWKAQALTLFSFIIGPGLGSLCFIQYVKWQARERQRKLTAQFPQALESMASALTAGSPVVECFKLLSEVSPEPTRAEFRRALVSMQLGKPFRDVLTEMSGRIHTHDFKLLAQAICISQDVGANLADVVATIAEAVRERFRLRDFVNSLTAQGRMTALFVGCLPYFVILLMFVAAAGFITPFFNSWIPRLIFFGFMLWEFLGVYILLRMTSFEV